jgi:hypothetical protein
MAHGRDKSKHDATAAAAAPVSPRRSSNDRNTAEPSAPASPRRSKKDRRHATPTSPRSPRRAKHGEAAPATPIGHDIDSHSDAQAQNHSPAVAAAGGRSNTNDGTSRTCHVCSQENPESGGVPEQPRWKQLFSDTELATERPAALAGHIIKRMGFLAYIFFFLVPLAFVGVVYAIVPLGNPVVDSAREQAVFLFFSNTAVTALYAFLYSATFLTCAERERPFHISLIPVAVTILVQLAILAPIFILHGTFDYAGVVSIGVFYVSLFAALWLSYPSHRPALHNFFRNFILLLAIYLPFFAAYLIGYRESGVVGQIFLAVGIAFGTFTFRRIQLSRLDGFSIDNAQLLSGFWVQNTSDVCQVFAFPQVSSPGVLFAIWFVNSFGNWGFLGFISNVWIYKIRPSLKNWVVNAAKCNFPIPPVQPMDESFNPVDRGHSQNVSGYRRRQFRFFFYRFYTLACPPSCAMVPTRNTRRCHSSRVTSTAIQ